jgi:hypothetical protein
LRSEAEIWQNARWKYLLPRLHQGKHPDTDPTFWNEWKETAPPKVLTYNPWTPEELLRTHGIELLLILLLGISTVAGFRAVLRWTRA